MTEHQGGVGEPDGLERLWTPYRMAYLRGENKPADSAAGSLTGAENRDGTSGVTVTDVDTDLAYVVHTSPPTAGGAVTFDYTVKGLLHGTWSTAATLRSDAINTIPIEVTKIRVR
jgi:hypothetical protein